MIAQEAALEVTMIQACQAQLAVIEENSARKLAEVHVKSWQETYQGLLPQSVLESFSIEQRTKMWTQILKKVDPETVCLGVWIGNQLVGFMHAGPVRSSVEGSDIELYALYLLKDAQGLGLGRELMSQFYEFARARNSTRASLLILKGNPTETFYVKSGWRRGPEFDLKLNGLTFKENCYVLDF
jgi:GNAT superfamily N-acetyltransferase